MELDFEADLEINPDELDVAALEQPNLAMKYSKEAAHYDRVAKKCYEKVKTIRSELIMQVSQDPDGVLGKGAKATAPVMEAYYRTHPDYIKAKEEVIEAEYQRDLAKSAADHIGFQRKKMIEIMASLLQMQYYSGPSVPRNLGDLWKARRQERQESGKTAATAALGRRRRK